MLQHPSNDFYDLSSTNVINSRQTPPYSPTGATSAMINTNNNNNNSSNNNLDINSGHNGGGGSSSGSGREALVSFGFTQEQVACVCEVIKNKSISSRHKRLSTLEFVMLLINMI